MKRLTPDDIPFGAMQTMAWAMDPMDNTVRSRSPSPRASASSLSNRFVMTVDG